MTACKEQRRKSCTPSLCLSAPPPLPQALTSSLMQSGQAPVFRLTIACVCVCMYVCACLRGVCTQYLRLLVEDEQEWDPGPLTLQGKKTTIRLTCPVCGNGSKGEDCFAFTVSADDSGKAASAVWCCHRATCGHAGGVSVHKQSDWAVQAVSQLRKAPLQQQQASAAPPAGAVAAPLPSQQRQVGASRCTKPHNVQTSSTCTAVSMY